MIQNLASAAGLAANHLASLFQVREDTARHWLAGRRDVPNWVTARLSRIVIRMDQLTSQRRTDLATHGVCRVSDVTIPKESLFIVVGRIVAYDYGAEVEIIRRPGGDVYLLRMERVTL